MLDRHMISAVFLLTGLGACTSEGPVPTFPEIYSEVLFPSCGFSACHAGSAGAPFLESEESAYSSLVGVESNSVPGAILVVSGDPDNSYLVHKLEDDSSISGDPMPPTSPLPAPMTRVSG